MGPSSCSNADMKKKRGGSKERRFWNQEYEKAGHLALSDNPSEDLLKFLRYLEREHGRAYLNPLASALDLGCGNGRNLIHLAKTYRMRGVGYDTSDEAVAQARRKSTGLPLSYEVRSIGGTFSLPDASQTLILDMMTSHVLLKEERGILLAEISRVVKRGGWFFFKTFLLDEDLHAKRLLQEHPGPEEGSYIHPEIGIPEHVFTEKEIGDMLSENFFVHKMLPSHRHVSRGRAFKRRSISVYAQRI
jgi:SAM-dependent methyltransferase